MGFFSKLFGRKNGSKTQDERNSPLKQSKAGSSSGSASPARGALRGNSSSNSNSKPKKTKVGLFSGRPKTSSTSHTDRDSPTDLSHPADEDINNGPHRVLSPAQQQQQQQQQRASRSPSSLNQQRQNSNKNLSAHNINNSNNRMDRGGAGPDMSQGTQRPAIANMGLQQSQGRVMSPRAMQQQQQQQYSGISNALDSNRRSAGPVDLDDTDFDDTGTDGERDVRVQPSHVHPGSSNGFLSTQRLEQFDMQPQNQPIFSMDGGAPSPGHKNPGPRFSAGLQGQQMEDSRSDAESSSFNLSTDAEDTEYENLRRRGVMPNHHQMNHHHLSSGTGSHSHSLQAAQQQQQQMLDTSALSQVSSPTVNYNTDGETSAFNTDGETSVFPNLPTDDERTEHGSVVSALQQSVSHSNNNNRLPDDEDQPGRIQIVSISKSPVAQQQSQSQSQWSGNNNGGVSKSPAQALSPQANKTVTSPTNSQHMAMSSSSSPNNSTGNHASASAGHAFSQSFGSSGFGNNNGGALSPFHQSHSFTGGVSPSPHQSRRSFTSPKNGVISGSASVGMTAASSSPRNQTGSSNVNSMSDDFNFADFSKFDSQTSVWGAEALAAVQPAKQANRRITIETDRGTAGLMEAAANARTRGQNGNQAYPRNSSSSAVGASNADNSLSELLAQAKSKSSSSRRSGGSVNSAPVVTSSYHRHSARSRNERNMAAPPPATNPSPSGRGSDACSSHDETSVSDIIKNLEVANASREKPSGSSSRSQQGQHSHHERRPGSDVVSAQSRDASTAARSAKERLREKRRREREGRRASGSPEGESSESDDNEDSWLFDEVTGALGPRGIAADLESLSGRSNRSNTSRGGRSHKSHRSHKSSHRRRPKTSSSESVDSHGSRRSKSSRYSHRSSRSYISQMSEQSRSVANDLLRLEMQLAMVGSTGDGAAGGDIAVSNGHRTSSVSGGSIGGGSRASRTSNRISTSTRRSTGSARRSRMTVVAPRGKLGIILANKADSKGTVVSGVRTSSVLADKISPGDRIVAIDGEDVSLMTVSEITTIMARKSDFERTLSVLTTPKHMDSSSMSRSPTHGTSDYRRY